MHNTEQANLEFKITFTETNIRYLLGENPRNEKLIAEHRASIKECQKRICQIKLERQVEQDSVN